MLRIIQSGLFYLVQCSKWRLNRQLYMHDSKTSKTFKIFKCVIYFLKHFKVRPISTHVWKWNLKQNAIFMINYACLRSEYLHILLTNRLQHDTYPQKHCFYFILQRHFIWHLHKSLMVLLLCLSFPNNANKSHQYSITKHF